MHKYRCQVPKRGAAAAVQATADHVASSGDHCQASAPDAAAAAVAAWASRLLARRAELPDLTSVLLPLGSDPELASILRRFVEVLVMTDGCVEI